MPADEPPGPGRRLRAALSHLHDLPYLQTHPFGGRRGKELRRLLTDGLAEMGAGRTAELLRLRYVEALTSDAVSARLGISQSEYYHQHALGLAALASLLADADVAGEAGRRPAGPSAPPQPTGAAGAVPHNLPVQVTSFVGRAAELAEVRRLLGTTRVLTLTGTGGCGKTRLALQAAAELLDAYPDGVWFADLAPVADPGLVAQAVAAATGLREAAGRSIGETLVEHARARRLLVLLDNCEHLVEPAARLADALVHAGPGVRILATSREALGIAGEVSWRVPSLALPPAAPAPTAGPDLLAYEAVRLFVDRATAADPAFRLDGSNGPALVQICRRLDGIPLALELAAARVKALSVEQIAARLDQRFRLLTGGSRTALPRQQTLAALVGWSYDLLSEPEKRLFDRLSVFNGRFALEAAERVCAGDGTEETDVLDLLVRLVEKSLVQAEGTRNGSDWYRLLETLRQYGRERLFAAGRAEALQGRHAAFYLDLAERAAREIDGPGLTSWLVRVQDDLDNLRLALHWSVEAGDAERALRLTGGLGRVWYLRGYPDEMRGWLDELLTSPAARGRTLGRAAVLHAASQVAWNQADLVAAEAYAREALAIAQDIGDPAAAALALHALAIALMYAGDLAGARASRDAADAVDPREARWNQRQFRAWRWNQRQFRACLLYLEGRYDDAEARFVEAITEALGGGDPQEIATSLYWQAHTEVARGRFEAAREHYLASLRQRLKLDYPVGVAHTLAGFANLAGALGQHERLVRLVGAAARLCEESATPAVRVQEAGLPRYIPAARAALGPPRFDALYAEGRAMSQAEAVAYAMSDAAEEHAITPAGSAEHQG